MKRYETNIDELMHKNGINTDRQLGKELGLSPQNISAKLSGDTTMKTLKMLSDYFEVPVKELLK